MKLAKKTNIIYWHFKIQLVNPLVRLTKTAWKPYLMAILVIKQKYAGELFVILRLLMCSTSITLKICAYLLPCWLWFWPSCLIHQNVKKNWLIRWFHKLLFNKSTNISLKKTMILLSFHRTKRMFKLDNTNCTYLAQSWIKVIIE